MSSFQNQASSPINITNGSNESIKTVRKPKRKIKTYQMGFLNKFNLKHSSTNFSKNPPKSKKNSDFGLYYKEENYSLSFHTSSFLSNKDTRNNSIKEKRNSKRSQLNIPIKKFDTTIGSEEKIEIRNSTRKKKNGQLSLDYQIKSSLQNSEKSFNKFSKILNKKEKDDKRARIAKIKKEILDLKNQFSIKHKSKTNLDKKTQRKIEILKLKNFQIKKKEDDEGEITRPESDRTHYRKKKKLSIKIKHETIKEEDENSCSSSSEEYYLKMSRKDTYEDFIDLNRYKNDESELEISKSSKIEDCNAVEEISEILVNEPRTPEMNFKRNSESKVVSRNSILNSKDRKKTLEEVLQLSKQKETEENEEKIIPKKQNFDMKILRLNLDMITKHEKSPSYSISKGYYSARERSKKKKKINIIGLESVLNESNKKKSNTEREKISFIEFKKKYKVSSGFKGNYSARKVNNSRQTSKKNKKPNFKSFGSNYSFKGSKNLSHNQIKVKQFNSGREHKPKPRSIKPNLGSIVEANEYNIRDFEIIEKLKKFKYGELFTAFNRKTKKIVVLKKISKLAIKMLDRSDQLQRETEIHNSLNNTFIAKLLGKFSTKENIYHIIEEFEKETLQEVMSRDQNLLQEKEKYVKCIIKALLNAVNYIHKRGIIHRDLNPSIIHVSKGVVKITDFSSATQVISKKHNRFLGKNEYAAPELLLDNKISFKNDSWNIGVIAFEMMTGHLPQVNLTRKDILVKIPHKLSLFCKDFLSRMLTVDYKIRLSIVDALDHKFLKS